MPSPPPTPRDEAIASALETWYAAPGFHRENVVAAVDAAFAVLATHPIMQMEQEVSIGGDGESIGHVDAIVRNRFRRDVLALLRDTTPQDATEPA